VTRDQVIEMTLRRMRQAGGLLAGENIDTRGSDGYEDIVVTTLSERLPDGEFSACEDFSYLRVDCCAVCHGQYAHYDMYVERMPGSQLAWICCTIWSALRAEGPQCSQVQG
jgi:hypothetical protein